MKIKDITIIALFSAIIFVQEQLLSFIPNVQLTMLLVILYTRIFGIGKTTIIVLIHTTLDNLVNGSFSLVYTPAMFVGWEIAVIGTSTLLKKCNNSLAIGISSIIFSIFYSLMFFLTSLLFLEIDPIAYLISDIWFTLIFALSNFVIILWVLLPLEKVLKDKINNSYTN